MPQGYNECALVCHWFYSCGCSTACWLVFVLVNFTINTYILNLWIYLICVENVVVGNKTFFFRTGVIRWHVMRWKPSQTWRGVTSRRCRSTWVMSSRTAPRMNNWYSYSPCECVYVLLVHWYLWDNMWRLYKRVRVLLVHRYSNFKTSHIHMYEYALRTLWLSPKHLKCDI